MEDYYEKLYKLYINIVPLMRGFIKTILYNSIFNKIHIGRGLRIKRNTEWKVFPNCTLIVGKYVIVGKGVTINVSKNAFIKLGDNVGIGNRCQIVSHKRIDIGEGTILAPNVLIYDHNHKYDPVNGVCQRDFIDGEVIIGKHCWIGAGCIILKDVHIGDNSIIGAGSVVTKDIPARCIAIGSPAKVIRKNDK